MSLISRMRKQTAVYWALASGDSGGIAHDDYGQPCYLAGEELDCRWEDVTEEFVGPNGTREMSHAKVYVDQDVDVGGMLMLGDEDNITDTVNIKENDGAWEIRRFEKLPTFRATEFLRTAIL